MKLETVAPITEKQFQTQVVELAKIYRWRVYHPFLSKWSEKGFPDLTLVRGPRLLFVELKREAGKVTPAQEDWLFALGQTRAEVYCWRPSNWDEVEAVLR